MRFMGDRNNTLCVAMQHQNHTLPLPTSKKSVRKLGRMPTKEEENELAERMRMECGRRLKEARKRKKKIDKQWTQQKVAELLGLENASTYGNWEQGLRYPPNWAFPMLARILDESPFYLMALQDYEDEVSLARKYNRMSDEAKRMQHRVAGDEPEDSSGQEVRQKSNK